MKIAVLTMCRDRLDYTKHCFASLRDNAGCDFDHYVIDQASTDNTWEWLTNEALEERIYAIHHVDENLGLSGGLNYLLARLDDEYDVVAHFDNDCEVVTENCLRDLAHLVYTGGAILSPTILGLNNPPQTIAKMRIGGDIILAKPQIGGIFLTAPGWVYDEFRYSPNNPIYGLDDVQICHWFRQQGGTVGYVERLEAWHYEGADGQAARYPEYWARKEREFAEAYQPA